MQKSQSETCNENHAEKTECQTLTPNKCVQIIFEGASTLFMNILAFSWDIYSIERLSKAWVTIKFSCVSMHTTPTKSLQISQLKLWQDKKDQMLILMLVFLHVFFYCRQLIKIFKKTHKNWSSQQKFGLSCFVRALTGIIQKFQVHLHMFYKNCQYVKLRKFYLPKRPRPEPKVALTKELVYRKTRILHQKRFQPIV